MTSARSSQVACLLTTWLPWLSPLMPKGGRDALSLFVLKLSTLNQVRRAHRAPAREASDPKDSAMMESETHGEQTSGKADQKKEVAPFQIPSPLNGEPTPQASQDKSIPQPFGPFDEQGNYLA